MYLLNDGEEDKTDEGEYSIKANLCKVTSQKDFSNFKKISERI
jgi:hypothetical protein